MSGRIGFEARSRASRGGRLRSARRPEVEALEGHTLLSTGGTPDLTYGVGNSNPLHPAKGLAFVNFAPETGSVLESQATGEALQPDGKLVVVGSESRGLLGGASNQELIAVARLTPAGKPDLGFGTGGAVALADPAGVVDLDLGVAVAVQADQKILILGTLGSASMTRASQVDLTRLNADGSVDASFGSGGSVVFQFQLAGSARGSMATTLAIDPGGDIVVGGGADGSGIEFARFHADGSVDAAFGTAGQVLVQIHNGMQASPIPMDVAGLAIDSGGRIVYDTTAVLASGNGSKIAVGRLGADGQADSTFGIAGQVLLAGGGADFAGPLAIQPDGKIVISGTFADLTVYPTAAHFDLFRLDTSGTLDPSFGTSGEAALGASFIRAYTAAKFGLAEGVVKAIAIQPDGKIVLGGSVAADIAGYDSMPTLLRVAPDGSPDSTFGTGGLISLDALETGYSATIGYRHSVYGLAIEADGKLLTTLNNGEARLLPAGAPNDFDNDGKTDPAVYIPSLNLFAYRPSGGGPDVLVPFGTIGSGNTLPSPGTYDGLGITELGVYLPILGAFAYRPTNSGTTGDQINFFGIAGRGQTIPAPADYTGAGFTEEGVYLPSIGSFAYLTNQPTQVYKVVTVPFGTPGADNSIPVPADYDGAGHDEIAVYLPALGAFAYRPAGTHGEADVIALFGSRGVGDSIPVPGDYDGSGHTELAVYLPNLGAFAYRPYGTTGDSDRIIPFGTPGIGGSFPAPGDYDGSGHLELGVYLPALGAFAYRPSAGGPDLIIPFGIPGSGRSIPFEAISATDGAFNTNGGFGGAAPGASWVDFLPDVAGHKKGSA